MDKDKPTWLGNLSGKELIGIVIVIVLILLLPVVFTQYQIFWIQFSDTGEIGDTIGGIMGPFIAIGAAVLTYMAFKAQNIANRDIKNDGEKQKIIARFYELLKIHKDNISEFEIRSPDPGKHGYWTGRRCFVYMFDELQLCYDQLEMSIKTYFVQNEEKFFPTQEWKINLVYHVFFRGVPNELDSEKFISEFTVGKVNHVPLVRAYLVQLRTFQEYYHRKLTNRQISPYGSIDFQPDEIFAMTNKVVRISKTTSIYYYPFDGHMLRLAHTYRHLFHTVKFVVAQNEKKLLEDAETIDLLRMLRAQLSNHEQLLLYYNGLSIGKDWFKNNYFTDWKMIHNLQLPLANFGIIPEEHPTVVKWLDENPNKQNELFEWPLTIYKPKIPNPSSPD